GGIHDVQAHNLADFGSTKELGFAVDQHDIAEAAHRVEGWTRFAERRNATILHKQVVEGYGERAINRRPIRSVSGLDNNRAVQPYLLREVFADVRVEIGRASCREGG